MKFIAVLARVDIQPACAVPKTAQFAPPARPVGPGHGCGRGAGSRHRDGAYYNAPGRTCVAGRRSAPVDTVRRAVAAECQHDLERDGDGGWGTIPAPAPDRKAIDQGQEYDREPGTTCHYSSLPRNGAGLRRRVAYGDLETPLEAALRPALQPSRKTCHTSLPLTVETQQVEVAV